MEQFENSSLKAEMRELRRCLLVLLDQSPSDAVAEVYIHRVNGNFRSLIEVYSSQGRFVAASEADSLDVVIDEVLADLERQIRQWRATRFNQAWHY